MITKRSAAFTVVELLIVLAVISVLAALLLPIFARVREDGRRTACNNNLKQLSSAIQQYVQENDSYYPNEMNWAVAIDPYIKDQQVFICPSQNAHGAFFGHPSDYDFNTTRFNFLSDHKAQGVKDSMVTIPTQFILLEDGDMENGAPGRSLEFPASCGITTLHGHKGRIGKGYSTVHSEGGNYLFGGGHVKWLKPEAARDAECQAGEFQPGMK